MKIGKSVSLGFGAILLAGVGSVAFAQDSAKVVEQRQALMKAMGGNLKALSQIAKGELKESDADVSRRAGEMAATAKKIATMFQAEYHVGNVDAGIKTTASDKIWQQPEQFTASANKLELASAELGAAADAGDQDKIKASVAALAKTCGGCHDDFRIKKQ